MSKSTSFSATGGCGCKKVRYELTLPPIIVQCCHCTWCQRETGTAFALNAMIETSNVKLLGDVQPAIIHTPSASGKGQVIARCPTCHVAVWSHYAGFGKSSCFVRVGTLDDPSVLPPDMHIFTSSKQGWVKLGDEVPSFAEYYDRKKYWPQESLERLATLRRKSGRL